MNDPTGLEQIAQAADSKLAMRAYDDLLAHAMKEGGKALADTVKAFRLFTAPIQLLAIAQDRLTAFCERVRQRVPEDRQVEAPASIAGPVLLSLRHMEDDDPLTELYLNLLARAIDKKRRDEAHPAFVKIIEQLSPDEAMVMYHFREKHEWRMPPPLERGVWTHCFPVLSLAQPRNFWLYSDHLAALNLLELPREDLAFDLRFDMPPKTTKESDEMLRLTRFGKLFITACIPEDFQIPVTDPDSAAGTHPEQSR